MTLNKCSFLIVGLGGLVLSSSGAALAMGGMKATHSAHAPLLLSISDEKKDEAKAQDKTLAAQDFITKLADQGIGLISKEGIDEKERAKEFRKLLHTNFDMKTIGRFSLGRYWKVASKAEQAEYLKLFEDMIVEVYSRRFSDYDGQALEVKSARAEGENDTIVFSEIVPQNGQKIKVDWRVRNKNGKFSVVDIIVEGVSMSLTQRADFASVIQRGGGEVEILLAHLRAEEKQ